MNYKKVKERIERKEEAVKNLISFLGSEYSYQDIMTMMAITQTQILELLGIANAHNYKQSIEEITEFFVAIQCLMVNLETLSDFAQLEHEDE